MHACRPTAVPIACVCWLLQFAAGPLLFPLCPLFISAAQPPQARTKRKMTAAAGGMAVVAVACALLVLSVGAQHLDQHTDESGSNRNLPQGSMWQVTNNQPVAVLLALSPAPSHPVDPTAECWLLLGGRPGVLGGAAT